LIVSLASTEFENGSGVNECANTDNISDVHYKFKRLGARLTYGVHTFGVQVCGMHLSVSVAFYPICLEASGGMLILLFLHCLAAFILIN